eukprot:Skav214361  [mRNA]  locus=scaffold86:554478:555356:+ [translate_table: standard]
MNFFPRESRAAMASFGVLPAGVLQCGLWAFVAVIWFLVLDSGLNLDASGGGGREGRGGGGNQTNQSQGLEVDVPEYDDYGSSVLSQFYLDIRLQDFARSCGLFSFL